MWYLVYRESDGQAVSLGTEIADPLPEGFKAYEIGEELPDRIDWDPATRSWALPVPEVPPEPVEEPVPLDEIPEPDRNSRLYRGRRHSPLQGQPGYETLT